MGALKPGLAANKIETDPKFDFNLDFKLNYRI